jgi:hypothetical protein
MSNYHHYNRHYFYAEVINESERKSYSLSIADNDIYDIKSESDSETCEKLLSLIAVAIRKKLPNTDQPYKFYSRHSTRINNGYYSFTGTSSSDLSKFEASFTRDKYCRGRRYIKGFKACVSLPPKRKILRSKRREKIDVKDIKIGEIYTTTDTITYSYHGTTNRSLKKIVILGYSLNGCPIVGIENPVNHDWDILTTTQEYKLKTLYTMPNMKNPSILRWMARIKKAHEIVTKEKSDLLGSPVLMADESTDEANKVTLGKVTSFHYAVPESKSKKYSHLYITLESIKDELKEIQFKLTSKNFKTKFKTFFEISAFDALEV